MKVSVKEFATFLVSYYRGVYRTCRLGQAFLNTYGAKVQDPVLYYENNDEVAKNTIRAIYVDYTEEKLDD